MKPMYYGVLTSGDRIVVVAYDGRCQPMGEPVGHYPFGVAGMLEAQMHADRLTRSLISS